MHICINDQKNVIAFGLQVQQLINMINVYAVSHTDICSFPSLLPYRL